MNSVSHINDPSDMSVTLIFLGSYWLQFCCLYISYEKLSHNEYMRNCCSVNIYATSPQFTRTIKKKPKHKIKSYDKVIVMSLVYAF